MDVANQHGPFGPEGFFALGVAGEQVRELGQICHTVHANVDDSYSGLHEVAGDQAGAADSSNQDVGAAADFGEVASLGMADGHGGVGVQQKHCHGFADNVTAANDNRFRTWDLDPASLEHFHDAGG